MRNGVDRSADGKIVKSAVAKPQKVLARTRQRLRAPPRRALPNDDDDDDDDDDDAIIRFFKIPANRKIHGTSTHESIQNPFTDPWLGRES